MSKTQIVWFLIMTFGSSASLYKGPIYGLITYMYVVFTWATWGDNIILGGFSRWSLLVSVITLISYILHRKTDQYSSIPPLKYLILLIVNMGLVSFIALDEEASYTAIFDFGKIIILYVLIIKVISSKQYYKYFLWVQLWGSSHLGWEGYTNGQIINGRLENIGIPRYQSSNHLAVLLIPIFPFIGHFALSGNRWEKMASVLAAPFILNAFIQCNSRGAFLGLIFTALFLLVLSTQSYRKKLFVGFILGSILLYMLAGEQFINRMQSIQNYEEDGSATGRLDSWVAALQIIGENPLGQGADTFSYLSPIYIPHIVEQYDGANRAVHNTYLMMATDWGVQGMVLYFIFLGSTIWELHRIRGRIGSGDDDFFHNQSVFIEVGLIGYLIAITFGNRIYGEVLYWYCALAIALSNIQINAIQENLKNHN